MQKNIQELILVADMLSSALESYICFLPSCVVGLEPGASSNDDDSQKISTVLSTFLIFMVDKVHKDQVPDQFSKARRLSYGLESREKRVPVVCFDDQHDLLTVFTACIIQ